MAKRKRRDRPDVDDAPEFDLPHGTAFDGSEGLFFTADMKDVYVQDAEQLEAIEKMLERDGMARMLESALTLPIIQAKGQIKPSKGDAGEAEDAQKRLLRPPEGGGMVTPLSLVRAQMTSAVALRRSYHEKSLMVDPELGGTSYRDIAFRPARSCIVLRDPRSGVITGFKQRPFWAAYMVGAKNTGDVLSTVIDADGYLRAVPPQRALIYIHGQRRQPIVGVSDLEVAYWAWQAKTKVMFLWFAVYLEGVALPRTVVKAQDPEVEGKATGNKIAGARSSGVIVTDTQTTIEALDLSGKGQSEFKDAISYLDGMAEQSVLLSWLSYSGRATTGAGMNGGAIVGELRDFFLMSRMAMMQEMDMEITRQVIAPITRWNHGTGAAIPIYESEPLQDADVEMAIDLLKTGLANPQMAFPAEFWDEMYVKIGAFLEIDPGKLRQSLQEAHDAAAKAAAQQGANPPAQQVAGMNAMATRAGAAVRARQMGQSPKKALAGG